MPLVENIMFEGAMGYIQSSVILKSYVQNKQLLNNYPLFTTSTRKIRVMWTLLVKKMFIAAITDEKKIKSV